MNILNIGTNIDYSFQDNITYEETNTEYIKKIILTINENTTLYINSNVNNIKINIEINVNTNISLNIFELKIGENNKIQYIYNLRKKSEIFLFKFNNNGIIRERNIFNLEEESKLDFHFKTISTKYQEYDFLVNHKGCSSISNLYLDGINILDGILLFNITGEVNKGIKDCVVNQESKIINLNDLDCKIKPNLLIDEYNVVANHSAKIGSFEKEKIFYLQSRGLSEKDTLILLIKGVLLNNLNVFNDKKEILEEIINEYWR